MIAMTNPSMIDIYKIQRELPLTKERNGVLNLLSELSRMERYCLEHWDVPFESVKLMRDLITEAQAKLKRMKVKK